MILVTGGTGFIGSHLVEALRGAGEPVRCLVRRNIDIQGAEIFLGDLATGTGLDEAVRGVHAVIHLAGVTKGLRPADYYTGNARATEHLARAVQHRPIRFVHVSSLAAIGPSRGKDAVAEDDDPQPLTHYGRSKLEAERIVRHLLPGAVIVRPPVVYGPRDTDVFQLLRSISRGLVLEIAGGERWFSAIYVEDLVRGIVCALHHSSAAGRAYFLTHPKPVSWSELAASAAAIMHKRPRVLRIPAAIAEGVGFCAEVWSKATGKPGIISRDKIHEARCAAWICDHRRAASELGFIAPTSLSDGLGRTLAWYKEAKWLAY